MDDIFTCISVGFAVLIDNWKPRGEKVHDSSKYIRLYNFPFHVCVSLSGHNKEKHVNTSIYIT